MFTICSMCFNNVDYLLYQEKIMRKLCYYDYKRIVINCNTESAETEKLKKLNKTEIIDAQWINNFSGSTAHGKSISLMTNNIETEYAIICDLDVVPLQNNWDKTLFDLVDNGNDTVGVPYNPLHQKRRIQNMPTVFFMAFKTDRLRKAKLYWETLPTKLRLIIYRNHQRLYKIMFRKVGTPRIFDFEMGQIALLQMKLMNFKVNAFTMLQPWEENAELKFDISELPKNRNEVDPIRDSYPEEWHLNGEPFVTHQRRSYSKSFGITDYSKNWVHVVNEYVKKKKKD